MSKHVYWVMMMDAKKERGVFGMPFECAFPDIEALTEALARDGVVSGSRLRLTDDGRGGRLICSREPYALGAAGVCSIQNFLSQVWEPEQ